MEGRNLEKIGINKTLVLSLLGSRSGIIAATNDGFLAINFGDRNPSVLELPNNRGEL